MTRSPLNKSKSWRTASKRQLLGKFNSGKSSTTCINGSNAGHVKLLIEGLQQEHDKIIAFLKTDLDDCKLEQEEALSTGMMKLPKIIRNMSVKDFNRKHTCDLLSLLKSKDGVVLSGTAEGSSNNSNNKDTGAAAGNNNTIKDATKKRCYETPAQQRMRRFGGTKPGTILRTARRGEGIFSHNGSPLEATERGTVIATVNKKRRGNESANVELNVGEGQYVSLNDPKDVSELNAEMKQTAASQLKVLQDQMACLMAQLTQ